LSNLFRMTLRFQILQLLNYEIPLGTVHDTLTHIGRYAIEGELGRGAMGVVFKAFDPLVERTVAIKTIPLNVEGPDLLAHRLQLEAKSVGQLEHPNIVTLYDAGEANGVFYLAMQFIQGETLRDRISRQRWFALKEIQEFLRQICSALDYAHRHGVIHRDIKPSNIMITPEGAVKLTDFGIAKVSGGTTTAGLIMGTPSYMSPEQALGKPLDGRSDIFSLGSILYELITGGEQAFPGSQASTVMYRIVHEPPSPVTALLPGFDPALQGIVFKALAKQPEQRYQTCAELAAELDGYAPAAVGMVEEASATRMMEGSRPDLVPTASLAAVETPKARVPRVVWLVGSVVVALVIVAAVWGIGLMRRPVRVPASAAVPSASSSETPEIVPTPAPSIPAESGKNAAVEHAPAVTPRVSSSTSTRKPAGKPSAAVQPKTNAVAAPQSSQTAPAPSAAPPAEQAQPETFKGYMLKGDLAFQQGRYEDALAAYSKAHELEPDNHDVRRKLAVVLTLLGRGEEARRYR